MLDSAGTAGDIASAARARGRPVDAALSIEASDRVRLDGCWIVAGFDLLDVGGASSCQSTLPQDRASRIRVDEARTALWLKQIGPQSVGTVRPSIDPVGEYFERLLRCPALLLDSARKSGRGVSLDSICNP